MMSPRAACSYSAGSGSLVGKLPMETKIVSLFMFATTAGMTAAVLLIVMHHNFGIPRDAIRADALLSAAMTTAGMIVFGFRRAK